jgi:hypothetical protein
VFRSYFCHAAIVAIRDSTARASFMAWRTLFRHVILDDKSDEVGLGRGPDFFRDGLATHLVRPHWTPHDFLDVRVHRYEVSN